MKMRHAYISQVIILVVLLQVVIPAPVCAQLMRLHNTTYDVLYNVRTNLPERVTWFILPESLGSTPRQMAGHFRQDTRTPKPRQRTQDYTRSGYDRGHMCPAADMSGSVQMMRSTFLLSNVCPMAPALNRGAWKMTETRCRMYAIMYGGVRVVAYSFILTGDTAYLPRSTLGIPTHFAKQVYTIPNDSLLEEWHLSNN